MAWTRMVLGAMAVLAVGPGALACEGGKVLLEETFARPTLAWGAPEPERMVAGGRMEVRPAAETMYWAVNEQVTFANVDACVDVVAVSSAAPEESFAGLVFWYRGVEDFYALEIDPVGHAAIWAMTKDGWRSPVDWGVSDLVVTGEGKVNRLRVVTKGGVATAYINGKLFREMKALAPPPAAQKVGIIAGSPRDSAAQFAFDNLKVTAPD